MSTPGVSTTASVTALELEVDELIGPTGWEEENHGSHIAVCGELGEWRRPQEPLDPLLAVHVPFQQEQRGAVEQNERGGRDRGGSDAGMRHYEGQHRHDRAEAVGAEEQPAQGGEGK